MAGGINLYAYVQNNPINLIDPFGLDYLVANPATGTITHFNDAGYEGASYPYTSGRDGVTDPSIPWKGPVPPGEYTLNPNEISKGSWLRDFTGDWGDYRVPLHPNEGTDTLGRENFFLHGGDEPGSAGCIDVGSNDTDLLGPESIIGNHEGSVTVIIK